MKEVMGAVLTSIATGISKGPSIGAAPSLSVPSFGESGGFSIPNTSFTSIFSETRPFSASPSYVREGPIGNPASIFNENAWSSIVKPEPKPSVDTIFPNTKPFINLDFGVKEGPAKIDKGEWLTIAKAPEIKPIGVVGSEVVEAINFDQKPQIKEQEKEKQDQERLGLIRLAIMAEVLREVQGKTGILAREDKKIEPKPQSKVQLQVSTEEDEEVKTSTYPAVQPSQAPDKIKTAKKTANRSVQNKTERYPMPVPVVDEAVQGNRKKTTKEKVATAFRISRFIKAPFVSGREIAPQLSEKKEHKSRLLYQLDAGMFPDGSFDEAVGTISYIPKIYDLSESGEKVMQQAVESVLEANRAVKISDIDIRNLATRRETKKVLKYVMQFLPFV